MNLNTEKTDDSAKKCHASTEGPPDTAVNEDTLYTKTNDEIATSLKRKNSYCENPDTRKKLCISDAFADLDLMQSENEDNNTTAMSIECDSQRIMDSIESPCRKEIFAQEEKNVIEGRNIGLNMFQGTSVTNFMKRFLFSVRTKSDGNEQRNEEIERNTTNNTEYPVQTSTIQKCSVWNDPKSRSFQHKDSEILDCATFDLQSKSLFYLKKEKHEVSPFDKLDDHTCSLDYAAMQNDYQSSTSLNHNVDDITSDKKEISYEIKTNLSKCDEFVSSVIETREHKDSNNSLSQANEINLRSFSGEKVIYQCSPNQTVDNCLNSKEHNIINNLSSDKSMNKNLIHSEIAVNNTQQKMPPFLTHTHLQLADCENVHEPADLYAEVVSQTSRTTTDDRAPLINKSNQIITNDAGNMSNKNSSLNNAFVTQNKLILSNETTIEDIEDYEIVLSTGKCVNAKNDDSVPKDSHANSNEENISKDTAVIHSSETIPHFQKCEKTTDPSLNENQGFAGTAAEEVFSDKHAMITQTVMNQESSNKNILISKLLTENQLQNTEQLNELNKEKALIPSVDQWCDKSSTVHSHISDKHEMKDLQIENTVMDVEENSQHFQLTSNEPDKEDIKPGEMSFKNKCAALSMDTKVLLSEANLCNENIAILKCSTSKVQTEKNHEAFFTTSKSPIKQNVTLKKLSSESSHCKAYDKQNSPSNRTILGAQNEENHAAKIMRNSVEKQNLINKNLSIKSTSKTEISSSTINAESSSGMKTSIASKLHAAAYESTLIEKIINRYLKNRGSEEFTVQDITNIIKQRLPSVSYFNAMHNVRHFLLNNLKNGLLNDNRGKYIMNYNTLTAYAGSCSYSMKNDVLAGSSTIANFNTKDVKVKRAKSRKSINKQKNIRKVQCLREIPLETEAQTSSRSVSCQNDAPVNVGDENPKHNVLNSDENLVSYQENL